MTSNIILQARGLKKYYGSGETQVRALDAIYDSPTFDVLSEEKGFDVRAHVIDDFYGAKITYIKDTTPVESLLLTNLPATFDRFGQLAVILHRTDVVQWLGVY